MPPRSTNKILLVLLILEVLFFVWIFRPQPLEGPLPESPTYKVQAGDTLWAIATKHYPHRDPWEVIHWIEEVNVVSAGNLRPGKVLIVPLGGIWEEADKTD